MIRDLYGGVSLVDKIIYFVFICILTHVSDRCDNYFFYDYEQVYDYEQRKHQEVRLTTSISCCSFVFAVMFPFEMMIERDLSVFITTRTAKASR